MPRFILTEQEKKRILELYLNEQTAQIPYPTGVTKAAADKILSISAQNKKGLKGSYLFPLQQQEIDKEFGKDTYKKFFDGGGKDVLDGKKTFKDSSIPEILNCVRFDEKDGDTMGTYTNGKKYVRVFNPNSIQVFWETGAFQQFVRKSDNSAGSLTKSGTYACNAQKNDVVISATDTGANTGSVNLDCVRFDEKDGDTMGTYTNGKKYVRVFNPKSIQVFWETGEFQQFVRKADNSAGPLTKSGKWSCNATKDNVVIDTNQTGSAANKTEWMTYLTDSVFNGKSKQYLKYKDQDSVYFPDSKTYYTEKEWFTVDDSGNVTKSGYWIQDKNKPEGSQFTQGEGKNPNEKTVTVAPPLENVAKGTASMKQGNQGDSVKTLQQMLIDKGYLKINTPTNFFGNMTYNAVLQFQKDSNLAKQDGIVGPETYAALYRAPEVQKTPDVNIQPKGIQAQPTTSSETLKAPTQIKIPNR